MVKIQFLSRKKTTGAQFGEQHLTLGLISHFTQHRDLSPKINPTQSTRGEMVVAAATKTIKIVAKMLFNQKKDGTRDNFYQNKLKWLQQRLFHIQLLFSQLYIYWQKWNEEWYLFIQGFGQLSVICSLALHTETGPTMMEHLFSQSSTRTIDFRWLYFDVLASLELDPVTDSVNDS